MRRQDFRATLAERARSKGINTSQSEPVLPHSLTSHLLIHNSSLLSTKLTAYHRRFYHMFFVAHHPSRPRSRFRHGCFGPHPIDALHPSARHRTRLGAAHATWRPQGFESKSGIHRDVEPATLHSISVISFTSFSDSVVVQIIYRRMRLPVERGVLILIAVTSVEDNW